MFIRSALASALIVCTALMLLVATVRPANAQGDASRPDIVLFIADDLSWHDVGAYGNRDVRTPNIDELADQGLVFDRAFAASPTCTPSRSALYTGLYPVRNGAHANHSLIKEGVQSLPHFLKALGYRVVLAGKTHIGPREQFPFEYLPDSNIMPPGKKHVLYTDLNTAPIDRLLETHDRKQPLALIVASHSPHVFWPANEGYDPVKLTVPPYLIDTPATREAMTRYYTDVTHLDDQVGQVRASLERHGYAAKALFLFTADQGAQFPFAKWNLYDAGIRVPLIAVWPGRTQAGTRTGAMTSLIDLLPTMVEVAGGSPPAGIDGRSFADVLSGRTQDHLSRVFALNTGDGKMNRSPMRAIRTDRFKYILNLRPDIRYINHISDGDGVDGRDYWMSWQKLAESGPAAGRAIRRFHQRPIEELYDLSTDAFEQHNLIDDPAYATIRVSLRGQLDAWRVQQGEQLDRVLMPEDARKGELRYGS